MHTHDKLNRKAATNHQFTRSIHHFREFQSRNYQTEIAAQFDIALHSTQKIAKNRKQT
ncbi:hypothetical protein SH601_17075 [Gracilibacillus sp. S3-1-1]|uniref:Uncharacterized protein n=1 Tax=Gracilibacillus pellucidus TaxID=3095368 RepID=A0ACC6M9L6_9BACI|nr:hypothetical protein [Gracilibacillus sp. S3-1-1]MDX8047674.1 hypothetical protein [Gracilibacillus sp. S3-1-1]